MYLIAMWVEKVVNEDKTKNATAAKKSDGASSAFEKQKNIIWEEQGHDPTIDMKYSITIRKSILKLNATEQQGDVSIVANLGILLSIILSQIREYKETSRDHSHMKEGNPSHWIRTLTMIRVKVLWGGFMSSIHQRKTSHACVRDKVRHVLRMKLFLREEGCNTPKFLLTNINLCTLYVIYGYIFTRFILETYAF